MGYRSWKKRKGLPTADFLGTLSVGRTQEQTSPHRTRGLCLYLFKASTGVQLRIYRTDQSGLSVALTTLAVYVLYISGSLSEQRMWKRIIFLVRRIVGRCHFMRRRCYQEYKSLSSIGVPIYELHFCQTSSNRGWFPFTSQNSRSTKSGSEFLPPYQIYALIITTGRE